MGRNGEESVEKKCTSNLDTGLIRGIILMIIPLSSPLDFVLVARNQIRITGAFFLTDSSTVSNHRKRSSLCLCAGKLLILRSSSPSILLFLPPVISSTRPTPYRGQPPGIPPWNTARQGQVDSVFLWGESGEESVGKKAAGNFGYRTDSLNNLDDYSANQSSGFRVWNTKPDPNYRLPFYNGL